MRIAAIVERAVGLDSGRRGAPANAVVNFSHHTVSLVAVVTDVVRHGRPVVGVAFDSIGRFAQSGILRDRMIPRVLAASPDALLDASGCLDPAPSWRARCATRSPAVTATARRPRPRWNWRAGTSTPNCATSPPT